MRVPAWRRGVASRRRRVKSRLVGALSPVKATPNREHVLKDASNNSLVKIRFYSLNVTETVSPHEFKSCDSLSCRDLSLPLFRAVAVRLSPIISHAARFRSRACVLSVY